MPQAGVAGVRYSKGRQLAAGFASASPYTLDTVGKRALYNNLKGAPSQRRVADEQVVDIGKDEALELAMRIDSAVRAGRPDGRRGFPPKEMVIKGLLWDILHDDAEVERIFLIIKAQPEF